MAIGVWISLFAYFALMIVIGLWAMRTSSATAEDYMLGGRALSPKVAALSAGASDMSGWLLLGLPGALYVTGLASAWIGIGLFVGAFINWVVVAPRLREQTVHYGNALTIPAFLANRFPPRLCRCAQYPPSLSCCSSRFIPPLAWLPAASCLKAPSLVSLTSVA